MQGMRKHIIQHIRYISSTMLHDKCTMFEPQQLIRCRLSAVTLSSGAPQSDLSKQQ